MIARNKFFDFPFYFLIGSYPEEPNGLHLSIRYTPLVIPLKTPCILIASIVYSEQVGRCRQVFGNIGEITNW